MDWMMDTADRRVSPRALWPQVRSIVMLGANYGPAENPLAALEARDRGAISVYARGRDYHELLKGRLKQLAGFMARSRFKTLRGQSLRRYGAGDGKAARRGRRLDGRASTPISSRATLAPGCFWARFLPILSLPRMRRSKTIAVRAGPAWTSARPKPFQRPINSMRGAASPISPLSTRPHLPRISRENRQSSLWLRRLPRGLSVE